jgi:hypothetical protein
MHVNDKNNITIIDNLLNFSKTLIIKDEIDAEKYETLETSRNAYEYISAYLKTDTNTELQRQTIINNYVENNKYYKDLYEKHNIEYIEARMAKNMSILSYSKIILSKEEYTIFFDHYYSNLRYFTEVLYTDSFKDNNLYFKFIKLFLVFATIQKYLASRLENVNDIDLYDLYSVRNMFISYGLDFYSDLPIKYQRRILKNINELLRFKGTEKAIVDVLDIFGFENIEIFKYYITKTYDEDQFGNPDFTQSNLKFVRVPYNTEDIESDILKSPLINYDSFVASDPFWQATKDEILSYNFSIINTKYLGINSTLNLLKENLKMSYFYNMIMEIGEKYSGINNLYFFNRNISPYQINLVNALIALNILVIKKMGFVDNILFNPSSVKTVYGYKFDEFTNPLSFNYRGNSYTIPVSELNSYDVDESDVDSIKRLNEYNLLQNEDIVEVFLHNKRYREKFEEIIIQTGDYKLYRKLRELWDIKFTTDITKTMFTGFTTYSNWLADRDSDLYNYVLVQTLDEDEKISKYNEKILELCSSIDAYIDSDEIDSFLTNNSLATENIKDYLYEIIRIFKSYTVEMRDLAVTYIFDSKLLNVVRLFDEKTPDIWVTFDLEDYTRIMERMKWFQDQQLTDKNLENMYDHFTKLILFKLFGYLAFTQYNNSTEQAQSLEEIFNTMILENKNNFQDQKYFDIGDIKWSDNIAPENYMSFFNNLFSLSIQWNSFVNSKEYNDILQSYVEKFNNFHSQGYTEDFDPYETFKWIGSFATFFNLVLLGAQEHTVIHSQGMNDILSDFYERFEYFLQTQNYYELLPTPEGYNQYNDFLLNEVFDTLLDKKIKFNDMFEGDLLGEFLDEITRLNIQSYKELVDLKQSYGFKDFEFTMNEYLTLSEIANIFYTRGYQEHLYTLNSLYKNHQNWFNNESVIMSQLLTKYEQTLDHMHILNLQSQVELFTGKRISTEDLQVIQEYYQKNIYEYNHPLILSSSHNREYFSKIYYLVNLIQEMNQENIYDYIHSINLSFNSTNKNLYEIIHNFNFSSEHTREYFIKFYSLMAILQKLDQTNSLVYEHIMNLNSNEITSQNSIVLYLMNLVQTNNTTSHNSELIQNLLDYINENFYADNKKLNVDNNIVLQIDDLLDRLGIKKIKDTNDLTENYIISVTEN